MMQRTNKHSFPVTRTIGTLGYFSLLASVLVIGACNSNAQLRGNERTYPELHRTPALDIQVFRHVTTLTMTNTTAHEFGPSTIWLNQRYSKPIDAFAIGDTLEIQLHEFHDEFGESFRGGGFFAADPPQRLVLTEIESASDAGQMQLYRLVVVADEQQG